MRSNVDSVLGIRIGNLDSLLEASRGRSRGPNFSDSESAVSLRVPRIFCSRSHDHIRPPLKG